MKFRTITGLLSLLIVGSCSQQTSKSEPQTKKILSQNIKTKGGLLIEKGGNRGTEYIDSLGNDYSFRYVPIFITNDSTIRISVQLAFEKEYDYSVDYGDGKFKVIPLPKEWGHNGTTDSMFDKMFEELPTYMNNPVIDQTIEPGEKITLGIGTLMIKPREVSININAPFAHTEEGFLSNCEWQMNEDPLSNPEIALGLELVINETCTIIPCGQISYPEH